ncbi:unnamed protein product [Victoria cruziana]
MPSMFCTLGISANQSLESRAMTDLRPNNRLSWNPTIRGYMLLSNLYAAVGDEPWEIDERKRSPKLPGCR